MTEILKPQSGESIYDPTCGSAGMLISCIAYLKKQGKEWRNVKVYGQEINQLTSAIGRMNLFLHGVQDFHIVNDDTLKAPAFIKGGELQKFDLVLANPPYSIKQWIELPSNLINMEGTSLALRRKAVQTMLLPAYSASMNLGSGRCAILFLMAFCSVTKKRK